jgi:large subunit ribosomal protein L6
MLAARSLHLSGKEVQEGMSRIGRKPIVIPAGVDVKIDGSTVTVKGPKGTLSRTVHQNMNVAVEDGVIHVTRPDDNKLNRSLHGLTRTLVANMVEGVEKGFSKELEINGVGYRAAKQGKDLVLNIGYSHQVIVPETDGIAIEVPSPNKVVISGPDKQKVGQFAAQVREKRPPEPYKGKGIKYVDEHIRRKEGKAGKGGK